MKTTTLLQLGLLLTVMASCGSRPRGSISEAVPEIKELLLEEYGPADSLRINRGLKSVAAIWRKEDGDASEFKQFCQKQFVPNGKEYEQLFSIVEKQFEVINGHIREINLNLDYPVVTHPQELLQIDRLFSNSKPSVNYFGSKLSFALALNFPYYTPAEKEKFGAGWTRKKWAAVRIGDLFDFRPDPENRPEKEVEPDDLRDYTNLYILSMDRILSPDMKILFPEGTRLNCHNGLRDEIKGLYTRPNSLSRQRMIYQMVMHIIDQTIPECMIGETEFFWKPDVNEVYQLKDGSFVKTDFTPEPLKIVS